MGIVGGVRTVGGVGAVGGVRIDGPKLLGIAPVRTHCCLDCVGKMGSGSVPGRFGKGGISLSDSLSEL